MIGIALITFVAVIGQGFRSSFTDSVDELFTADYALTGRQDGRCTNESVRARRDGPGRQGRLADPLGRGAGSTARSSRVNGIDANLTKVRPHAWANGSDDVPAELGSTGAIITKSTRRTMRSPSGRA